MFKVPSWNSKNNDTSLKKKTINHKEKLSLSNSSNEKNVTTQQRKRKRQESSESTTLSKTLAIANPVKSLKRKKKKAKSTTAVVNDNSSAPHNINNNSATTKSIQNAKSVASQSTTKSSNNSSTTIHKQKQRTVVKSSSSRRKNRKKNVSSTTTSSAPPSTSSTTAMLSPPPSSSLSSSSTTKPTSKLFASMQRKLAGGRFRWLNEQLYTRSGADSLQTFASDNALFDVYHSGYVEQVRKWPVNPLDGIISDIRHMMSMQSSDAKALVVADMGCGEARLARELTQHTHGIHSSSNTNNNANKNKKQKQKNKKKQKKQLQSANDNDSQRAIVVHSFDLIDDAARGIVAANLAAVPLEAQSVDVVVFCLSLMGTDWPAFIDEARRILRPSALLKIVEVGSRFADKQRFVSGLNRAGFSVKQRDVLAGTDFFFQFDCTLRTDFNPAVTARQSLQANLLKPCIYKRR